MSAYNAWLYVEDDEQDLDLEAAYHLGNPTTEAFYPDWDGPGDEIELNADYCCAHGLPDSDDCLACIAEVAF